MNLSSALPILFSTLSIIILPSTKTLVAAQAVITAQPDQPTITSANGGLERYRFCGSARNERCVISTASADVIAGVPGATGGGPNRNRDDCSGGSGSGTNGQCVQDDLFVRRIAQQPPAGQGTCEVEQCDPTSLDPTCSLIAPVDRKSIYWRQSATNRVYTKTTTCTYQVCTEFDFDNCKTALVTWTINPFLQVEDDEATLSEDKASIDIFVIRDNVISTRDTRVTRIVSPNPTFGTCEVIPDPSFANGRIVRYTRPSNTFDDSAFSPPDVICNYEVCTIPLAGETRECKTAKIDIDVKKPIASITVNPNTYNINLNTDVVDNRVVLEPPKFENPLFNDSTNPPGRPLVVDEIVTQIPGNGANGQCLVDFGRNTVVFRPGNNNQPGQTVSCVYRACTRDNGVGEDGTTVIDGSLSRDFRKTCGNARITFSFTGRTGPFYTARQDPSANNNDRYIIGANQPFQDFDVLANDDSNREKQVISVTQPSIGRCEVINSGRGTRTVRYVRESFPSNRNGFTSCRYRGCTVPLAGEQRVCGQEAIIRIDVRAPNPGIRAVDDLYTLPLTFTGSRLLDVLDNDSSIRPGRRLRVDRIETQISNPARGQCTVASDGNGNDVFVEYTRGNTNNNGDVQCTYRACTDDGAPQFCDFATVTIRFRGNAPNNYPSKFIPYDLVCHSLIHFTHLITNPFTPVLFASLSF